MPEAILLQDVEELGTRGTVIEVERTVFRADRYRMVFFRQR